LMFRVGFADKQYTSEKKKRTRVCVEEAPVGRTVDADSKKKKKFPRNCLNEIFASVRLALDKCLKWRRKVATGS